MAIAGGVIGSLQVNIVATTDKFIKGISNAKSRLDGFVSSISTVSNLVELLGVRGFVQFIRGAIDAGSQLFGLTKKLHISAEGISALHFAAEQLNTSTEALDIGLSRMSRTLGEALLGNKQAAVAFGELGLNFQTLSKLPVEQQFLAIVDALNKIPDTAKRAAIAQAIFGRETRQLAALFEAGTDKIIEQGKAAAESGALVGTSTTQSLQDASKAIKKFSDVMESLKLKLVGDFAPEIGKALSFVSFLVKNMEFGWMAMAISAEFVVEQVLKSFMRLGKGLNFFLPKSMQIDLSGLKSQIDEVSTMRQNLIKDITPSEQENPLKATNNNAVAKNTATANDKLDELIAQMKRLNGVQDTAPAPAQPTTQVAIAGVR